jgi:hypothetical protein
MKLAESAVFKTSKPFGFRAFHATLEGRPALAERKGTCLSRPCVLDKEANPSTGEK